MIIPCMKSTSACDRGGRVPFVEDGSVLLGCPGAPGCTTTGGAEPLCCARESGKNEPTRAFAAMSMPSNAALRLAESGPRLRQKQENLVSGMWMRIFECNYATTSD